MTRAKPLLAPLPRLLLAICLLGSFSSALGEKAQASSARGEIDQALARLDIPAALSAYDEAVGSSGPSLDLLARIAEEGLRYCMKEGRHWNQANAARALAARKDPSGRKALVQGLEAESSQIRSQVAVWVGDNSLEQAIPVLGRMAGNDQNSAHERLRAARALLQLGDTESAREAAASLRSHERADVRGAAAELLGRVGGKESREMLRQGLGDPEMQVVLESARGLARLGVAEGKTRLKALLSHQDSAYRVQAAWYLASLGDRAGLETVRAVVKAGMENPAGLPWGLSDALYVLSWIDAEGAVDVLLEAAGRKEWIGGRAVAGRRLAELGHELALPTLRSLHAEVIDNVKLAGLRQQILHHAGHLGPSPELSDFAQFASSDAAPQVVRAALELRAGLADVTVLPDFRRLLGSADLGKRVWAAEAVLGFGRGRRPVADPFLSE